MADQETPQTTRPYRVLARKYRPQNFDQLIGQDALVRTLKNAIDTGRIAHAFMLTGVRGVGKTTTARIIAKALNYTGPDGTAGPTTGPTDDCAQCQAIKEDRHPDVMEMDAASRTGIDDIREILDGVRYAPVSARFKVYIIDEVHMLSKAAFNALLKTLEEPPPHVKFIFATTEIRKVPVTVLSRCQRFDLRRVDVDVLAPYFEKICAWEQAGIEPDAALSIARAADGSVRDGLSLLDQAIARAEGVITASAVSEMLGLADRGQVLSLYEDMMQGHVEETLAHLDNLHRAGADPVMIMQDLLEVTHDLTLVRALKAQPVAFKQTTFAHADHDKAINLAQKLTMPVLHRAWALLLKGLQETQQSADPQQACTMSVLRLMYAADLPDPTKLIRDLNTLQNSQTSMAGHGPTHPQGPATMMRAIAGGGGHGSTHARAAALPADAPDGQVILNTFEDLVRLCEDKKELQLASQLRHHAHVVRFDPSAHHFEYRPAAEASSALSQRLPALLNTWTGARWMITLSKEAGQPTLTETKNAYKVALKTEALGHPIVQAIINTFPGTELSALNDEAGNLLS